MASAKGKVVVSAEVPVELRDQMDGRATQEGRSRSELLARAVRFYLRHAPVVPADDVPPPIPEPQIEPLRDVAPAPATKQRRK